jgi:hypothetical protein
MRRRHCGDGNSSSSSSKVLVSSSCGFFLHAGSCSLAASGSWLAFFLVEGGVVQAAWRGAIARPAAAEAGGVVWSCSSFFCPVRLSVSVFFFASSRTSVSVDCWNHSPALDPQVSNSEDDWESERERKKTHTQIQQSCGVSISCKRVPALLPACLLFSTAAFSFYASIDVAIAAHCNIVLLLSRVRSLWRLTTLLNQPFNKDITRCCQI